MIFTEKTNISSLNCECNFITQWPPTCFDYSCGHLHGGKKKNTNIIVMCQYHSTVKNDTDFG